jgi:adenylate cyclase
LARPDGARIRERRRRKGLSVLTLATRAGVAERTLRRLERNHVDNPHPQTIRAIAGALGVEPEELFSPLESDATAPEVVPPFSPTLPGMEERTVPGFGARPAIAVLRFENLGSEPDQQYFADGLVEDLIARLSAWRVLPVIAGNSSLHVAAGSIQVEELGRRLGVRYLLRGSIRRAADRVRIGVQLVDAVSGHPIWADRYDRQPVDVLLIQDEIGEAIMARLAGEVSRFEANRAMELSDTQLQAWDICMRAYGHVRKITPEDAASALRLFEKALEIDPQLALAWVGRAHAVMVERRFLDGPLPHLVQAKEWAQRAIQCDPRLAQAYSVLATICANLGELPMAAVAIEQAIQLDPSSPHAQFGRAAMLAFQRRPQEASEHLIRAMRLDPWSSDQADYLRYMALCCLLLDRYEEAASWGEQSVRLRPDLAIGYCDLAAAYGLLGRANAVRATRARLESCCSNYSASSIKSWISQSGFWPPGLSERYFKGLRTAGWTELLD